MSYTYEYPRPALTVDCLIFLKDTNDTKLLLIQRDKPPFEGKWALPGGFVNIDELLLTAATRELEEETGLTQIKLKQFFVFDAIDRDPRERTISIVFYGFAEPNKCNIKANSDARNVQWFSIKNIPQNLAFDHNEIIQMALEKLRTEL